MRGYLGLKQLVEYCGLSVRTLQNCLRDKVHPRPHYRIGGRVPVRLSEFDEWVAHYKTAGPAEVAGEVVRHLASGD